MPLASPNTDVEEYQFHVSRSSGGRVSCVSSANSSVIKLDRSQERPVPQGAAILDAFLDKFEAREDVSKHLPQARKELAGEYVEGGAPVTLRMLRLRQGFSQCDLAISLGTSQAAVSEYEGRKRKPSEDQIRGLAIALNVDFNTLMDALANG